MFYGFKYHIFTITAIFAALGLGILIGTSLISDDILVQEQERLIENIRSDIRDISDENIALKEDMKELKEELSYRKEMEKRILSFFVQDEFENRQYVLHTGKENLEEYKNKIKDIGLNIKIVDDIEKLEKDKLSKLILWNYENKDKIQEKLDDDREEETFEILSYDKPDLIGLIMKIMEREINDKN